MVYRPGALVRNREELYRAVHVPRGFCTPPQFKFIALLLVVLVRANLYRVWTVWSVHVYYSEMLPVFLSVAVCNMLCGRRTL